MLPLTGGSIPPDSSAFQGIKTILKYCLFVRQILYDKKKKSRIRDKRYFQKASAVNKNVHMHVTAYNGYTQTYRDKL